MRFGPGLLAPAMLGLVLAMLAWRGAESAGSLIFLAGYPFGLDYGEGIVLQQALLVPGTRAYGDIDTYPFIVFHYPPVYLLLVRGLVEAGIDPLLAGRMTSLTATGCVLGLVGYGSWMLCQGLARHARLTGALVTAMLVLTSPLVTIWGAVARVDMVAIALSLGAIILAAHAVRSPRRLYLAVLLSVLAVFTKQTAIAASGAIVLGLLLVRPRDAVRAMIAGLGLGAVGFAGLTLATDGGFLRHIVAYNVNRFSVDLLAKHLSEFALHVGGIPTLLIVLAGITVVPGLLGPDLRSATRREEIAAAPHLRLLVMAGAALGVVTPMLLLMAKSGSNLNYAIEWLCYAALFVGLLVGHMAGSRTGPDGTAIPRLNPLPALLLLPPLLWGGPVLTAAGMERHRQESTALLEEIRAADHPVLSDDMVLLVKAGKPVPWESAIFAELASTGMWDEGQIIDLISARAFAFIITEDKVDSKAFRARYNPAVAQAIAAAYPVREQLTFMTVHRPSGAAAANR